MVVVIGILIYPSIAMAVWWNPFTWKIFNWKKEVQVEDKTNVISTNTTPVDESVSNTKTKEIEELKKEVADLKKKVSNNTQKATPASVITAPKVVKPKTFTLPSGAVIDDKGNLITPAPNLFVPKNTNITQKINPQLLQVAKQMLDTNNKGILLIKNTYQTKYDNASKGQKLCMERYDSNVARAKSDAEYLKTYSRSSGAGGIMNTGTLNNIDQALAYDLETYRLDRDSCLLSYNLPDSSILGKLNQLSNEVSSLRSRINTPSDAVLYQNELRTLGDDILSVADSFRTY